MNSRNSSYYSREKSESRNRQRMEAIVVKPRCLIELHTLYTLRSERLRFLWINVKTLLVDSPRLRGFTLQSTVNSETVVDRNL